MHQCTFKDVREKYYTCNHESIVSEVSFRKNSSSVFGHHYLLQTKSDFLILKGNLDHKL